MQSLAVHDSKLSNQIISVLWCFALKAAGSNKLKHYRAVATRQDKHDANDLAFIKLIASRVWTPTYDW